MCQTPGPASLQLLELLAQVYQAVQPLIFNTAAWAALVTTGIIIGLRRMYFPCVTLRGLKRTVQGLENDLVIYRKTLPTYHNSAFDRDIVVDPQFVEYKARLLQAQQRTGGLSLVDRNARSLPWWPFMKRSLSIKQAFKRQREIIVCYKEVCLLRAEIEHATEAHHQTSVTLQLQPNTGVGSAQQSLA